MATTIEEEYHIKFPKTEVNFTDEELTFSINHVKSRLFSTLYYIFTGYDMQDNLIYTYTSKRWLIDTTYRHRENTFNLPSKIANDIAYYQIELVAVGISSENPLWFNEVMFQQGEFTNYHIPQEAVRDWEVKFNKTCYAELYSEDGQSLQVIRPQRDSFTTNRLTKSNCTVLAPHLENESDVDDPVNIYLEFINQTDQRVDVLR